MIVKVAEVVEEFPQASVAVNITEAEPVAPQVSETEAKLLVQVTFEQTPKPHDHRLKLTKQLVEQYFHFHHIALLSEQLEW